MDIIEQLPSIALEPYVGKDTNKIFVSTDYANQYMVHLLQEKNAEGRNYAMTEGVLLANSKNKTISDACDLLVVKYTELIERHPDLEGIYTVANAAPSSEDLEGRPDMPAAHQNWFFYDRSKHVIVRFEPNGPYFDTEYGGSYRFADLLDCINRRVGIPWVLAENVNINPFSGCRATSTILALMHLAGKDLTALKGMDRQYYKALAVAVTKSMYECEVPILPRTGGRKRKGLVTFVEPSIREREAISKASKRSRASKRSKASKRRKKGRASVIRGDSIVGIFDFNTMTVKELKNYLKERGIPYTSRDLKPVLVRKALQAQDTLILVE